MSCTFIPTFSRVYKCGIIAKIFYFFVAFTEENVIPKKFGFVVLMFGSRIFPSTVLHVGKLDLFEVERHHIPWIEMLFVLYNGY